MDRDPYQDARVRDVGEAIERAPSVARPGDPLSLVVERLLAKPDSRMVYAVDEAGRLVGTVSWRSVLKAANARLGARRDGFLSLVDLFRNLMPEHVEDLMRKSTPVTMDTPLRTALVLMADTQQNDLPIVDDAGRLVGELNGAGIMRVALDVFRQTEADLARARAGLGKP